jgi:hypothetical protein
VTTNFHTDFLADIKGFGQGSEALVQWQWDGTGLEGGTTLRPDTGTQLQRQTKVDTRKTGGGPHVLSVSLLGDEKLKIDNTRSRVFEVASELKVLIIEGERGTSLLSGSGAFLDLALAPKKEITAQGKVRSDSYVAPEVISDLEFGNKVLNDYRAVILSNVASLSPAQADAVAKFVEAGGTFMAFMGEQVNADQYREAGSAKNHRGHQGFYSGFQAQCAAAPGAEHLPRRGKFRAGYCSGLHLLPGGSRA